MNSNISQLLDVDKMSLQYGTKRMEKRRTLSSYQLKDQDVLQVVKTSLTNVDGIKVSYAPDTLKIAEDSEAKAEMSCGHVMSTEGMTMFLLNLVKNGDFEIRCPTKDCSKEWDYEICK